MKHLMIAAILATGMPAMAACGGGSPMAVKYRAAPPEGYLNEQELAARLDESRRRPDGAGSGPGTGAGY